MSRVHGAGFQHRAVGGEIAEQHGQAALLAVGIVQRADHVAIFHDRVADVFAQRFAGDGDAVEIQRARFAGEGFEDRADSAGTIDIFHVIFAGRRDFADIRHARADFVEMGQVEWLSGFDGDGQRVQHRVGRAAHGHIEGEGVFESLVGEDVARADVLRHEIDDPATRLFEQFIALRIGGEDAAVARERPTERFAQAVHAVGGEHAGARAAGWAGVFFDVLQLA